MLPCHRRVTEVPLSVHQALLGVSHDPGSEDAEVGKQRKPALRAYVLVGRHTIHIFLNRK